MIVWGWERGRERGKGRRREFEARRVAGASFVVSVSLPLVNHIPGRSHTVPKKSRDEMTQLSQLDQTRQTLEEGEYRSS